MQSQRRIVNQGDNLSGGFAVWKEKALHRFGSVTQAIKMPPRRLSLDVTAVGRN